MLGNCSKLRSWHWHLRLSNWTKWQHPLIIPEEMAWRPIQPTACIWKISEATNHSKMRKQRCCDKRIRKLLIFNFLEKPAGPSKTTLKINQATFVSWSQEATCMFLNVGVIFIWSSFSFVLLWIDLTRQNLWEVFWGSCWHMQPLKQETNTVFFLKAKKEAWTALRWKRLQKPQ